MTTSAGSVLEGVDNDVLLVFIALLVIIVSTIIYFANVNRNSLASSLTGSWTYLSTVTERQSTTIYPNPNPSAATDDVNSRQDGDDVQSHDGRVEEQAENERESGDSTQNELSQQVIGHECGSSEGNLNKDSHGEETDIARERSTSEGQENRGNHFIPGSNQTEAGGDCLRSRTRSSNQPSQSSSQLSIRVKHHEVERSYVVDPNLTVGELKRLSFPDEVAQGQRVRFVFSGRLLQDDSASISFYGISMYSVIHAQISDVPQHASPMENQDEDFELDMSRLLIPVFTLILCGCWYGRMTYRHLFDTTSTAILLFMTAAYGFMVYVMFY